jgi:hypothetical protein
VSVETIRDQVKTVLGTAAGISTLNVLDVEAWSEDPEWFRDHFVEPSGRACGWWIETRSLPDLTFLGYRRELYEFTLKGVLGYGDAGRSRAEAEEMQRAVLTVFQVPANRRLGGTVNFTDFPSAPPKVRPFWAEAGEDRLLCHLMEVVVVAAVDVVNA